MAKGNKNLGDLLIGIQLRTKELEKGMNQVQRELKKNQRHVQKTGRDYDKLAITAGIAFYKIAQTIRSSTAEFKTFDNSIKGLKSIVDGTGNSFAEATGFIESFTKDGLVPTADAATSLKNLLNRGFNMDQAADVLDRFKDSASYGRQESLSLGEAIRGATEGLKNENSILVDNAGVTKNVSKMWEEYASTIGKTRNQLTQTEKIQAEYVGIMKETKNQVGDAAKYSKSFAGAESEMNAEIIKLKKNFGEGLVPYFETYYKLLTPIIRLVSQFIKEHKALSGAVGLGTAGIVLLITAFTGFHAIIKILIPALKQLKVAMAAVASNPYVLALAAIATAVSAIAIQVQKATEEQEAYNEAVERYNRIRRDGIQKSEIAKVEEEISTLDRLINQYDILMKRYELMRKEGSEMTPMITTLAAAEKETGISAKKLAKAFRELGIEVEFINGNMDDAIKMQRDYRVALEEARRVTADEYLNRAQSIALKNREYQETKLLINAYKQAESGSTGWYTAQKKLAEQFPQFSTASGVKIKAIEDVISTQEKAMETEWKMLQTELKVSEIRLQEMIASKNTQISELQDQQDKLGRFSYGPSAEKWVEYQKHTDSLTNSVGALQSELELVQQLFGDMGEVPGIMPIDPNAFEEVKAYENKALDSQLRILAHKKSMDELTLAEEENMLNRILAAHVKTAEERMDIEERLYQVKKKLLDESKKSDEEYLQTQEDYIRERHENSMKWVEDRKLYDDMSIEDEKAAYDRMIKYHKDYINDVIEDERIAADDVERIRAEQLDTIRTLERKKYQIQKEYIDKSRDEEIQSINNMASGIESALRKKYQKLRTIKEAELKEDIEDLRTWQEENLDSINRVYDAKMEAIRKEADARKKALEAEIKAIDKAEQLRLRKKTDDNSLSEINSLKKKIEFEHDDFNKQEMIKKLNKLVAEREERLYQESLEDKKEALKDEVDAVEENADKQIEIIEKRKAAELEKIRETYEYELGVLESRREHWQGFYDKKMESANLQAEAEKILMTKTQDEILVMLKSYGQDYQIAGQSLGEKLYQGFKPEVDKIKNLINEVNRQLDIARNNALEALSDTRSKSKSGSGKSGSNINIKQNINFNKEVSSPSKNAKALRRANHQLVMDLE